MGFPHPKADGFTLTELLVVLVVVAVLGFLVLIAFPIGGPAPVYGQLIRAMNNGRGIHMAVSMMAGDGWDNKEPDLGWPGDLKARGRIATAPDLVALLVRYDYLKSFDLKVFATAGVAAYTTGTITSGSTGILVPPFEEKNSGFKIFLVKAADAPETVLLTTKNYTYNTPLDASKAKPLADKGFVVVRKDGAAAIYKKQQAQDLATLGPLPGGGTAESTENCLNPGALSR